MNKHYNLIVLDAKELLDSLANETCFKDSLVWSLEESLEQTLLVSVEGHKLHRDHLAFYTKFKQRIDKFVFNAIPLTIIQTLRIHPIGVRISGSSIYIYKKETT